MAFRLRQFGFFQRLGLTGVLACLAVGQLAGLSHMREHFDKRDDRPGFTRDDIKSAYHGLEAPSPLLSALRGNHPPFPPSLKPDDKKVLTAWLTSGKIEQDYDNPDLGAASPREIIAASCLRCHSARADAAKQHAPVLDTPADIKKVAFTRKVLPTPPDKVAVSIHAHASSMSLMALAVMTLAAFSRWPRFFVGLLSAACGLGLAGEFAGMWFAQNDERWVGLLIGAGGAFHVTFALLTLLTLLDLWLPGGRGDAGGCGGACTCRNKRRTLEADE
ncbi:MAG: hypothetical protein K2Q09_07710 [Phycisphaerales bacterium]|nr:hypothetical protein [Phycisphaerales bacterium]